MQLGDEEELWSLQTLSLDDGIDIRPIDPVTFFPPEITTRIFLLASQFTMVQPDNIIRRQWLRKPHPLSFGKVCRSWRAFAWSTPELWTTVVIRLQPSDTRPKKTKVSLVREWLSRAKGFLLEIHVSKVPRDFPPSHDIINLLKSYSPQWHTVHLHLPASWCGLFNNADPTVKLFTPNLRVFYVSRAMAESTDVIANGPLNLTDAPILHDLTLEEGANLSNSNAYILFPLQQIDRLGLLNFTALETVQQLTRLPNLVEARFIDVRLITQEPTTAPAHTKLARLYLCFSDDETLGYFTSALTLPALESLEVKVNYKSSSDFAMNTIHPFLHRSQCKLAKLRLRYRIDNHDSPDLVGLLARLSSLRELDICAPTSLHTPSGLDNRLFDALRHLQHPSFLPSLQIFSYEGPFLAGTNLPEIMEPLILRATDEASHGIHEMRPLESVWIQTDYLEGRNLSGTFLSPDVLINVNRLVASGVFQLVDMKGVSWFSK